MKWNDKYKKFYNDVMNEILLRVPQDKTITLWEENDENAPKEYVEFTDSVGDIYSIRKIRKDTEKNFVLIGYNPEYNEYVFDYYSLETLTKILDRLIEIG